MIEMTETNRNMAITNHRVRSCDTSHITAQKSKLNLQRCIPIIKQEAVQGLDQEKTPQCIAEEETLPNDYMSPCKPLQPSECANYYDSKFYVLDEVKKEFPEDECPQPVCSRLVFENEEFSKITRTQHLEQENQKEGFSSIVKDGINDTNNQFMVKIERPEEHRVSDNAGVVSNHYNALVTPQTIQCNLCRRTFKNRFDLLQHNNQHIKIVMYRKAIDKETNELCKCRCCNKYFNNYDTVMAHLCNVDRNPYCTRKNGIEMKYTSKCYLCKRIYKTKNSLLLHIKRIHSDYGKIFECRCGKQFRSPVHLREHKSRLHNIKSKKNDRFQCDICQKIFKHKMYLIVHINIHNDYGKLFECWCGKQFSKSIQLHRHKIRVHSLRVENENDSSLQTQFECDFCHKFFKLKDYLIKHIKSIHYDYGKSFECWCGKQFSTPMYLHKHRTRHIDAKVENGSNDGHQFQCHICHKILTRRTYLAEHIKNVHECWCGKQFSTPERLRVHEREYNCKHNSENDNKYKCEYCGSVFKVQRYLTKHMKRMHWDQSVVEEINIA